MSYDLEITGGVAQGIVGAESATISTLTIHNYYDRPRPSAQRSIHQSDALTSECPYPGLSYFGPAQRNVFFGREALIKPLADSVKKRSFNALVGPSGSGKSSVVLAGVAPELAANDNWVFSYFRIGTEVDKNPFRALSSALVPIFIDNQNAVAGLREIDALTEGFQTGSIKLQNVLGRCRHKINGRRLLLIADQFEEVFTLIKGQALREQFIDLLLSGFDFQQSGETPDVGLMITLRADFFGMALRYRPLSDALQGRVQNLGPMQRVELRDAIEKPAGEEAFEAGLVDTILDDVASSPGNLPLLQFALRELWLRQGADGMTHTAYQAIGTVDGALAKRAEDILARMTDGGSNEARLKQFQRLFTRLVTPGKGVEDTRRVVNRNELDGEAWQLAQRLADEENRLLVTGVSSHRPQDGDLASTDNHETVEIVHEALIRNWPTLVNWLNRDREFLSWLEQMKGRVDDWKGNPRDVDTLLAGGPLLVAEDWLHRRAAELSDHEKSFVEASLVARAKKRRRRLISIGLVSLGFTIFLAGLVFYSIRTGQLQAQSQEQARLALYNQSLYLVRQSGEEVAKGDIDLSLLLALEALPKNLVAPERPLVRNAVTALIKAVFVARRVSTINAHQSPGLSLVVAPDESWLLSGGADGTLAAYSLVSRDSVLISRMKSAVVAAASSDTGKLAVTASVTGSVAIWETSDWQQRKSLEIGARPTCIAFLPAATTFAICKAGGEIVLYDENGNEQGTFIGADDTLTAGRFDGSGSHFVAGASNGFLYVWDVKTKALIRSISVSQAEVWDFSLNHAGTQVIIASEDGVARLVDTSTGDLVRAFEGHRGAVLKVAIDEDSGAVLTVGADGNIIAWDLSSGSKLAVLGENSGSANSVELRAGKRIVVAADQLGNIRIWNWGTNSIELSFRQTSEARKITFLPKMRTVVSLGDDGRILSYKIDNLELPLPKNAGAGNVTRATKRGELAVLGFEDGSVRFWDHAAGTLNLVKEPGNAPVVDLQTPECMGPATMSLDGVLGLWPLDLKSPHFVPLARPSSRVRIDSGCKLAAVMGVDSNIRILSLPHGDILFELPRSTHPTTSLEFGMDGTALATGDSTGHLTLWSTATGSSIADLQAHSDRISTIAFTAEGLISASWDGSLRFWDLKGGRLAEKVSFGGPPIASVKRSLNKLVVGRWNGKLELWSLSPFRLEQSWQANHGSVASLDYTEKQGLVVSGFSDGVIVLWDAETGEQLTEFDRRASSITSTAFTADGSWVLSEANGDVRFSQAVGDLSSLTAEAHTLVKRSLSETERAHFGITLTEDKNDCQLLDQILGVFGASHLDKYFGWSCTRDRRYEGGKLL
ncbi:hypothetical protein RlegWSM1455_22925 [Rhizobium laguerreae]|uniref:nSTAND1 domain-containing NTPase n=1 Tax=Rhizobium laguerreae TaxID=1076926 RepID=UPI001E50D5D6|nr:hypothetical protein [Rhizobium laguerreae]UFW64311.1 hypothetical protein RlegWSM1455_22925 [Rhizobium laguerreae]